MVVLAKALDAWTGFVMRMTTAIHLDDLFCGVLNCPPRIKLEKSDSLWKEDSVGHDPVLLDAAVYAHTQPAKHNCNQPSSQGISHSDSKVEGVASTHPPVLVPMMKSK